MDINASAPVISRDEILVRAPIAAIWEIQTDVAEWPSWQPEVDGAQAHGPLAVGSVFRWQTAGLDITSTVEEVDAPRRIVWGGAAQGIVAVHVWVLDQQEDGVLVRTEESWEGDPVDAQVEALQGALDGSLRNWLKNLKRTAEDRAGPATASLGSQGGAEDEMPERVASQDGTPIAIWRSGEGPPLVLVHGATADHSRWAPVLPALEERFTVLAIDRRGRGRSGDGDDYALEREAEDVVAVIQWAGEPVNLLGHSHGGVCALEAALLTDKVRKLVLYEPPMGFLVSPPDVVHRLQALLEAGERDELLAFFMREVAGLPDDQVELMRSLPAWQARLAAADTIPREERANREYVFDPDRFGGLRVPTLFLQGGDSPEPFRAAAEALRAALPDCRIAVMPGQRHAAMDTGTELFTAEVLSFLDATDKRQRRST